MSAFTTTPEPAPADHHDHPPHLAHHFDTPEQQFDTSKVGMWAFLATEILMFGGLFCAYAVYRYNNPDVFKYSEHHLNTWLGATNTVVLLASSLTMALAVRAAQLGQQTYLKLMLVMTLLGGVGFMVIKSVEYAEKFQKGMFPGRYSVYDKTNNQTAFAKYMAYLEKKERGDDHADKPHGIGQEPYGVEHGSGDVDGVGLPTEVHASQAPDDFDNSQPSDIAADAHHGEQPLVAATPADQQSPESFAEDVSSPRQPPAVDRKQDPSLAMLGPEYVDPHFGTSDAAVVRPAFNTDGAVVRAAAHSGHSGPAYTDLSGQDQQNIKAFFGIYYMMTGLHGVHVLIGMGLIGWVLVKSLAGTFGPAYFTPVDLVGLYWHLVDLIWIFLFPLLYLIH
jgi:cytochrome c oxidase subunit 3